MTQRYNYKWHTNKQAWTVLAKKMSQTQLRLRLSLSLRQIDVKSEIVSDLSLR